MINVMQPSLGTEELNRIKEVFDSNWIGKGRLVSDFEDQFSKLINSSKEHVISTNCCTEALFSSMQLCNIKPGDEVIVPTISFVGAGNAVCANGSKLVLCDCDPKTLNTTVEEIEKKVTEKTKAILLMHYGGNPCDMDSICDLAKNKNISLIEDCAPGVCSSYKGKSIGTFGDIGMWSFDAMKLLVCGDGAMMHFNNPEVRERADKLFYFGLMAKSGYENSVAQKWWEFDISCYGHRAIMNDITAAIALEQLKKLPQFIKRRKQVHEMYTSNLKRLEWIELPQDIQGDSCSSYYFYHIQIKNGKRDDLARFLREKGIYTTYRYYPLHRVSYYNICEDFPGADYAADNTLCLPIHQSLSEDDVMYVIDMIREFGKAYM